MVDEEKELLQPDRYKLSTSLFVRRTFRIAKQTAGSEEVWLFLLRIIVRNEYLLGAPPLKEQLHALLIGFTLLFCYQVK